MSKSFYQCLIIACVMLSGCGVFFDDGGECPKPRTVEVRSGLYELNEFGFQSTSPGFPASQDPGAMIEVDREAGQVTVMYERDGSSVVETYAITNSEFLSY